MVHSVCCRVSQPGTGWPLRSTRYCTGPGPLGGTGGQVTVRVAVDGDVGVSSTTGASGTPTGPCDCIDREVRTGPRPMSFTA